MHGRKSVLALSALLLLVVCLGAPASALAVHVNQFTGYGEAPLGAGVNLTGTYAKIDGEAPPVNSQGFSGAWTMLELDNGKSWMQVGYMRDRITHPSDPRPRWFTEVYTAGGPPAVPVWYGLISSGRKMYQITSDGTNYYFLIDSTTKDASTIPMSSISWNTDAVLNSGEVYNDSSDFCGGSSVPNNFGSATYKYGGTWTALNPLQMNTVQDSGHGHLSRNSTSFNMWDDRVSDVSY